MTPAEKLGMKIGQLYVLARDDYTTHVVKGQILKFISDDDSEAPYFKVNGGTEGSTYKVGNDVCVDIRDLEPFDKPAEILDTKAILKKYISIKYPADTFLDFLVDNV